MRFAKYVQSAGPTRKWLGQRLSGTVLPLFGYVVECGVSRPKKTMKHPMRRGRRSIQSEAREALGQEPPKELPSNERN